jgi:hypothetical protein
MKIDWKLMWEVYVPTMMNGKPIKTKYHKEWDKVVREIAGGLSIAAPVKGQYLGEEDEEVQEERIIPVRIACSSNEIQDILRFTLQHYNQEAVLCHKVSDEAIIVTKD